MVSKDSRTSGRDISSESDCSIIQNSYLVFSASVMHVLIIVLYAIFYVLFLYVSEGLPVNAYNLCVLILFINIFFLNPFLFLNKWLYYD